MNESQNNMCVDTGTLLSLHNGALSPDEARRVHEHLASCEECAANDRYVQQGSNEVYGVLASLGPAQGELPDTAKAFVALQTRMCDEGLLVEQPKLVVSRGVGRPFNRPRLLRVSRKRQYGWLAVAVAAALLALLLLPNAGVLASQFLSLFQVKQFQPVSVSPQDLNTSFLQDLQNFGHVDQNLNGGSGFTPDQTEAQVKAAIHFSLLLPTHLPSGVSNTPQFLLFQGGSATFTFDAAEARAYLAQKGYKNVSIPSNLDGSIYTITMSPGAVITYQTATCQGQSQSRSQSQAKNAASSAQCMALAIAEIPSPVIQSSSKDASLSDLKDFFVSLPDQTDSVRTLLQHVDLNNGVVPLPIPPQIHAQQVTTHGSSGLLLNEQSLKVGAVLWQAQGIIYLVAAQTGDSSDLMTTVNSLQG